MSRIIRKHFLLSSYINNFCCQVYNRCIQQLKLEKDDLERESPLKMAVKPQIKQPKIGSHVKSKQARRSEDVSASFDELPDSTDSAQTSPSVDGTGKASD